MVIVHSFLMFFVCLPEGIQSLPMFFYVAPMTTSPGHESAPAQHRRVNFMPPPLVAQTTV